ncbi:MAG TPA: hypothetical protein DIT25_04685 [Candidatus Moranbacteria bacterium]|nr:hypothetical protein [Candidatus Moranbacteria bacterium]
MSNIDPLPSKRIRKIVEACKVWEMKYRPRYEEILKSKIWRQSFPKIKIGFREFAGYLQQKGEIRLEKLKKSRKDKIVLSIFIILLGIGAFLFFSEYPKARADKPAPMEEISLETVDPLNKIGKGLKADGSIRVCHKNNPPNPNAEREREIQSLVAGHPIENMIPYIAERDEKVSSFLVAIAKKESNWGKHTPKKKGKECYNFWGYRGKENTTDSGYSCFDSPEHAVKVVGDRIEKLVEKKVNTPERMVVWKCGSNCEVTGGQAAADKWIRDVAFYYKKLQS